MEKVSDANNLLSQTFPLVRRELFARLVEERAPVVALVALLHTVDINNFTEELAQIMRIDNATQRAESAAKLAQKQLTSGRDAVSMQNISSICWLLYICVKLDAPGMDALLEKLLTLPAYSRFVKNDPHLRALFAAMRIEACARAGDFTHASLRFDEAMQSANLSWQTDPVLLLVSTMVKSLVLQGDLIGAEQLMRKTRTEQKLDWHIAEDMVTVICEAHIVAGQYDDAQALLTQFSASTNLSPLSLARLARVFLLPIAAPGAQQSLLSVFGQNDLPAPSKSRSFPHLLRLMHESLTELLPEAEQRQYLNQMLFVDFTSNSIPTAEEARAHSAPSSLLTLLNRGRSGMRYGPFIDPFFEKMSHLRYLAPSVEAPKDGGMLDVIFEDIAADESAVGDTNKNRDQPRQTEPIQHNVKLEDWDARLLVFQCMLGPSYAQHPVYVHYMYRLIAMKARDQPDATLAPMYSHCLWLHRKRGLDVPAGAGTMQGTQPNRHSSLNDASPEVHMLGDGTTGAWLPMFVYEGMLRAQQLAGKPGDSIVTLRHMQTHLVPPTEHGPFESDAQVETGARLRSTFLQSCRAVLVAQDNTQVTSHKAYELERAIQLLLYRFHSLHFNPNERTQLEKYLHNSMRHMLSVFVAHVAKYTPQLVESTLHTASNYAPHVALFSDTETHAISRLVSAGRTEFVADYLSRLRSVRQRSSAGNYYRDIYDAVLVAAVMAPAAESRMRPLLQTLVHTMPQGASLNNSEIAALMALCEHLKARKLFKRVYNTCLQPRLDSVLASPRLSSGTGTNGPASLEDAKSSMQSGWDTLDPRWLFWHAARAFAIEKRNQSKAIELFYRMNDTDSVMTTFESLSEDRIATLTPRAKLAAFTSFWYELESDNKQPHSEMCSQAALSLLHSCQDVFRTHPVTGAVTLDITMAQAILHDVNRQVSDGEAINPERALYALVEPALHIMYDRIHSGVDIPAFVILAPLLPAVQIALYIMDNRLPQKEYETAKHTITIDGVSLMKWYYRETYPSLAVLLRSEWFCKRFPRLQPEYHAVATTTGKKHNNN
jgi:hypothetical protein